MDIQDLKGKHVVIALGGNALGDDPAKQVEKLKNTASHLVAMLKEGVEIVITYGNGPQVGIVDEAFILASGIPNSQVPHMPLHVCDSMSQGYIGAQLTLALLNELHAQGMQKPVGNVPTHIVVDKDDPAFHDYQKPIGAFMSEDEAKAFAKKTGCKVGPDSGRGWRRMVPSPTPQKIVELEVIKNLIKSGCATVAAGGGGSPVFEKDGQYTAVDAIIDKDLVSSILARSIDADILIILTAVECAYVNFNKPDQKAIHSMTVTQAKEYCNQGQFAPGAMLPKVEACIQFVEEKPGRIALITELGRVADALHGKTGTFITSDK